MTARVSFGGELSDPFEVLVGVKRGCVLAPVIFNLFLVAVTLFFRSNIQTSDGVPFNFRLDGNLFNLRRLLATVTKRVAFKQKQRHLSTTYLIFNTLTMLHYPVTLPRAYSVAWLVWTMPINVLVFP